MSVWQVICSSPVISFGKSCPTGYLIAAGASPRPTLKRILFFRTFPQNYRKNRTDNRCKNTRDFYHIAQINKTAACNGCGADNCKNCNYGHNNADYFEDCSLFHFNFPLLKYFFGTVKTVPYRGAVDSQLQNRRGGFHLPVHLFL